MYRRPGRAGIFSSKMLLDPTPNLVNILRFRFLKAESRGDAEKFAVRAQVCIKKHLHVFAKSTSEVESEKGLSGNWG